MTTDATAPAAATEPTPQELETARILARAKALLAKAEATEFPEEAQALGARAYQMVAARGIDVALLTAGAGPAREEDPVEAIKIRHAAPYARDKMILTNWIFIAMGCHALQVLMGDGSHASELHGYRSDLQRAQMMAQAILAQAQTELAREAVPDYTTPKKFRRSWYKHFTRVICGRIKAAEVAARADATRAGRTGADGTSLEMVLVSRADKLRAAFEAALLADLLHTGKARASRVGDVAKEAGQAAGRRADLGGRHLAAAGEGRRELA